ncbi:extracellular solute-binding protein [Bifidobacterium amazonense]|uniref:Extracellular solute-binding protein n=1 Tax=Bifidobacterium amazonense TaxID=2809027 RepID=A0ABS9VV70_9BIFI|nr:extracellular solute-binding protein [Bifidobacterium amazonense]MCH9275993.1 extracellular solute-binding protein [Bifidobacterium amazonense]
MMKPMKSVKRITAVVASAACLLGAAACGNTSSNDSSASSSTSNGPVEIEAWGWDKNAHIAIDKFNKSQNEVKVKYVLQASNTATQQNFRNAFEAKSKLPDFVQGFAPLTTNVSNGWAEDITDAIQPLLPKYTDAAKANASLDGKYYGLPGVADGTYAIFNTDVLAKYGVDAPKTWDDVIALGEKMKADGGTVMNLAGEDPSGFMQIAQAAGAKWFSIDGDNWVVNMQDEGTDKAVDIIQTLIDGDMVSHQTYQDKPALYNYFDSGKLGMTTLAYWSSTGYKTNMPNTSGKWEAGNFPQVVAGKDNVPGIISQVAFIPKGTSKEHQEAVIKWINWQNTPEGYEAGRDPDTNTLGVPAGRTDKANLDVEKYIDEAIPDKFYSNDDEAKKVILNAAQNAMGGFDLGPDYDAWFPELQDQWGKAVAKQITLKDAIKNVQKFIVNDLKDKGINVKEG